MSDIEFEKWIAEVQEAEKAQEAAEAAMIEAAYDDSDGIDWETLEENRLQFAAGEWL